MLVSKREELDVSGTGDSSEGEPIQRLTSQATEGSPEDEYIQRLINQAAEGGEVFAYYDISMTKTVDGTSKPIHTIRNDTDTTGKIELTIDIPEDSWGHGHYSVIHVHNGRTFKLEDVDDDEATITIVVDRFSTFALMYDDRMPDCHVGIEGTEGGTIVGDGWYAYGASAVVVATSMEGYQFDGWFEDGVLIHGDERYEFTATKNRVLKAYFVQDVVPTPSPTPSVEPSPTPSAEPSPTPSVEPSPTPSAKPSPMPSPTPSMKPSPMPSVKPSPTPSVKPSPTPSVEPSATPSVEPSPTPSPTSSVEPSPMPSMKPSAKPGSDSVLGGDETTPQGNTVGKKPEGENKKVKIRKPKKVSKLKVTSKKKHKKKFLHISFRAVKGADRYEIVYSTNAKFRSKKMVTKKATKFRLRGLKKNKKYYIKVRAFTVADGKKVYGPYSKKVAKKVK